MTDLEKLAKEAAEGWFAKEYLGTEIDGLFRAMILSFLEQARDLGHDEGRDALLRDIDHPVSAGAALAYARNKRAKALGQQSRPVERPIIPKCIVCGDLAKYDSKYCGKHQLTPDPPQTPPAGQTAEDVAVQIKNQCIVTAKSGFGTTVIMDFKIPQAAALIEKYAEEKADRHSFRNDSGQIVPPKILGAIVKAKQKQLDEFKCDTTGGR